MALLVSLEVKYLSATRSLLHIIDYCAGLPHPDYFPFSALTAEALVPDSFPLNSPEESSTFSWLWKLLGTGKAKERTTSVTIPKYPVKPTDLSLSTALQYSMATGLPQIQKIIQEFTGKVYTPAYENYTTLLHAGNTDGWSKAVLTLCNPGEGVLASEWTYPSALSAMLPYGINPVPIPMDSQGMRSDSLRILLSEWDEAARGMPR